MVVLMYIHTAHYYKYGSAKRVCRQVSKIAIVSLFLSFIDQSHHFTLQLQPSLYDLRQGFLLGGCSIPVSWPFFLIRCSLCLCLCYITVERSEADRFVARHAQPVRNHLRFVIC